MDEVWLTSQSRLINNQLGFVCYRLVMVVVYCNATQSSH